MAFLRCDSVRFQEVGNLTVRFGSVRFSDIVYFSMRFGAVIKSTVWFGAALNNRKPDGAVRCGFQKS